MACACKVNQKIEYIHQRYGYNIDKHRKRTKIRQNIKIILKNILVYTIILPLLPLMAIHVIYVTYFTDEKMINIGPLLKKRKNGK